MQLVVQPVNDSVLEQLNKFSAPSSHLHTHTRSHPHVLDDVGIGLMEGEGRDATPEPSPFSTKKDMYSGKGGTQVCQITCSSESHIKCVEVVYVPRRMWMKVHLRNTQSILSHQPVALRWKNLNNSRRL